MSGFRTFLKLGELSNGDLVGTLKDAYEIDECIYTFEQGIDENGKVQTEVRGGTISITMNRIPSFEFIKWGVEARNKHSGYIVIFKDDAPLEKTYFEDAACIGLKLNFVREGKSYLTTQITLQARTIKIEDSIKLDMKWTE